MWRKSDDPNADPSPSASAREEPSAVASPSPSARVDAPPPKASPIGREATPVASHLTGTLLIKGEITGSEDLFIEGQLQGKIRLSEGRVTIGEKGRVNADVEAREIVIRGSVKGKLYGSERLEVGLTGRADGDLLTPRILIEDGAEIHGRVEISRSQDRQIEGLPNGKQKGGFAVPPHGA